MERKLEPGFEAIYSTPSDLMQSTMKSEPQLSCVSISTCGTAPVSPSGEGGGVTGRGATGACAWPAIGLASVAAPATAAPRKKLRRPTPGRVDLVMALLLLYYADSGTTGRGAQGNGKDRPYGGSPC